MKNNENHEMAEYRKCVICGGSFVGVGNVCPGCEAAMERDPVKVRPRDPKDVLADISREVEARAKEVSVSDILATMRRNGVCHDPRHWAELCDRISAAHKRELDELAEASVHTNGLLTKQVNEKDVEIVKLRSLVKGLLDASSISCADCLYDCYSDHSNCIINEASKYLDESEAENG